MRELFEGGFNFLQFNRALPCGVNSKAGRNQGNMVFVYNRGVSMYGNYMHMVKPSVSGLSDRVGALIHIHLLCGDLMFLSVFMIHR